MATRRSSRLQNPPQAPVNDKQDVLPVKTGAEKKGQPKPPAEKPTAKSGVVKRPAKAVSIRRTTQKAQPMPPAATTGAKISLLPPEVMKMVLDNITEQSTMSALGRTSKTFYSLMMPRLYGRIAVAAMFHAHIPKLIRTIEPHLTIAQKKQLKKEGTYKGQQERYASGLDQKAIPICAGYVRQLVVGVSDPGKKHRYICDRYVEEALKNMVNLRIVETRVLSE